MLPEPSFWLAITQDGRYFVLDEESLPPVDGIIRLKRWLDRQGTACWLAATQQNPDSEASVEIEMLCLLTDQNGDWATARTLFRQRHAKICTWTTIAAELTGTDKGMAPRIPPSALYLQR